MTIPRPLRNRISIHLFLVAILAPVITPFAFLHHHSMAVIFAVWSLFWFGMLYYHAVWRPRILRVLEGVERRRLFTNPAIAGVFFALFAVAAFYGSRGVAVALCTCELYLAGFVSYRFLTTREQPKAVEWMLAAAFVRAAAYSVYGIALDRTVSCNSFLPLACSFGYVGRSCRNAVA